MGELAPQAFLRPLRYPVLSTLSAIRLFQEHPDLAEQQRLTDQQHTPAEIPTRGSTLGLVELAEAENATARGRVVSQTMSNASDNRSFLPNHLRFPFPEPLLIEMQNMAH